MGMPQVVASPFFPNTLLMLVFPSSVPVAAPFAGRALLSHPAAPRQALGLIVPVTSKATTT